MATKMKRRMWTDEQKQELVDGYEALPEEERPAFLEQRKVDRNWFYKVRQNLARTKAARRGIGRPVSAFAQLPEDEQRRLILEYMSLPTKEQRDQWREQYSMSPFMPSYWHTKLVKGVRKGGKGRKGSATPKPAVKLEKPATNQSPYTTEQRDALAAEYMTLSRTGGKKSVWLQEKGLSHQTIFSYKQGYLARQQKEVLQQQGALQQQPFPRRALSLNGPGLPHIPVGIANHPDPTLEEVITSFEVQRDQLNTFIDQLKRMRGGR